MNTAIEQFASDNDTELNPETLKLAQMFLGQDVYCQGLHQGCCTIWLRIGDGSRTMIGYGLPGDALMQAVQALDQLHNQALEAVETFVHSFNRGRFRS